MLARRQFLKLTVASVGGVVAACGPETDVDRDGEIDAGDTLPVDGGDGIDAGDGGDAGDAGAEPLVPGEAFFRQSVASGDPTPTTVILWTRVDDPDDAGDLSIALQLAADEQFASRLTVAGSEELSVIAEAAFDRCVKVRLEGLQPDTVVFYRFVYRRPDGAYVSRTGRTRTAPAVASDRTVRFAFVSCQDFTGAFYNPYKRLVNEAIDFVVHLGDYVYETDGDPSFQASGSTRRVVFSDVAGAITLGAGDESFLAAASLSNYRELYRTYRSDPWLQRMHERFPFIITWDDHEFSDDCWGTTATYFDGTRDESSPSRRQNASQAWFENMPVDYPSDPQFRYDASVAFPDDLRIWRDLRWGAHVHLVMTDLRTRRPDHVIGEAEHPGRVAVTESALIEHHGGVPEWASPYVDLTEPGRRAYLDAVEQWCTNNSYSFDNIGTNVRVAELNAILAEVDGAPAPIADSELDALPKGVAIAHAGKASLHSSLGSRSLAVQRGHDLISAERWRTSAGRSENLMGDEQRAWFLDRMQTSDATWKVWGNEFCLLEKVVDVSTFPTLPESLKQRFYLSVEDWAGAMNERDALIEQLSSINNVVAITGDIHAFFADAPFDRRMPSRSIHEFVTSSISSGTYERLLVKTANSDPGLREAGAAALALLVPDLLTDVATRANPGLAFAEIAMHGYAIAEVDAERFAVTFTGYEQNLALEDLDPTEFAARVPDLQVRLEARAGDRSLWREFDGVFRRWDAETLQWVDA